MLAFMSSSNHTAIIAGQFRAALAMLRHTVENCPEALWTDESYHNRFWHIAYHSVFYTHFYLHPTEQSFVPWAKHRPKSQSLGPKPEQSAEVRVIPAPYSREEVLEFLALCYEEVEARVEGVSLDAPSGFDWLPFNRFGVHLYNLRHLAHHTGQLSDRLREECKVGVPWVRLQ